MREVRSYETRGGIGVECSIEPVAGQAALDALTAELDAHRGVLLASSYEYPGRYTRWDMGFVDPPLVLVARGRSVAIEALNARGVVLLPPIARALADLAAIADLRRGRDVAALPRARTRGPLPRGGTQPPAVGVLGAARVGRSLRIGRRPAPRALRRLRLRPRASSSSRCGCGSSGPRASATSCSTCPTSCWSSTIAARLRRGAATSSAATALGRTGCRARVSRHPTRVAPRSSERATTRPASTPASCGARRSPSGAAISSRSCPARPSSSRRSIRPPPFSVACGGATRRPTAS